MELYELLGWKYGGRLASDPVGIFDAGEYSISSAWNETVIPTAVCQKKAYKNKKKKE